MGFFKKIFKGIKKIVKAPFKLIKRAFKGDPLAIVSLAASIYGGYSLLAEKGLTAAMGLAVKSSEPAIAGLGASQDLAYIGQEIANASGITSAGATAVAEATQNGGLFSTIGEGFKKAMEVIPKKGVEAIEKGVDTSQGLFGKISNWWHNLSNKDKLMVASLGAKTVGSFLKGYQNTQLLKKTLRLEEEKFRGIGEYKPIGESIIARYQKLKDKAKMWYETDPALQKRINHILTRLEDPEYARGFYTLAGLLANPKGYEMILNDPYASIYS